MVEALGEDPALEEFRSDELLKPLLTAPLPVSALAQCTLPPRPAQVQHPVRGCHSNMPPGDRATMRRPKL